MAGPRASTVSLRYRDRQRMLVRGPATGQLYEFSPQHPIQGVHAADAQALLETGRFMRG